MRVAFRDQKVGSLSDLCGLLWMFYSQDICSSRFLETQSER